MNILILSSLTAFRFVSQSTYLDLYSEFTAKIPSKFGGGYGRGGVVRGGGR